MKITKKDYMDAEVDYIGGVIKLFSSVDVEAAATVAKNIKKRYNDDEKTKISNKVLYEAYFKAIENKE